MNSKKNWHNLEIAETLQSLNSSRQGLTGEEAQRRLAQFGPNELTTRKGVPAWVIFLEQFKSIIIIMLLVAIVLSLALGEVADSIVMLVIVVFCAVLGFVQEYRADRALEALRQMTAPTASVVRDGQEEEIAAQALVPGDIILLKTGDHVSADARLLEAINLKTEEAPLTGESLAVEKATELISGEVVIGDRKNMVYTGTTVVYGRGKAVVTSTGMNTEFGQIAAMLQEVEKGKTPLQINLNRLGKWLVIGITSLIVPLALVGIMRGHEILEMLVWGVALAVAAVPSSLPAVVVIALAIGLGRMAKRHALVRRLTAVETLGCTTVICSDKTGTLTQDQMTVRKLYTNGQIIDVTGVGYEPRGEFYINGRAVDPQQDVHLETLLRINTLCNDTRLVYVDGAYHIKGDPTEGALIVAAAKSDLWQDKLNEQFPRVDEVPFSSEAKRMTTIHDTPWGKQAYAKGAPEVILDSCDRVFMDGQEKELSDKDRANILKIGYQMADDALRVLAMAYKPLASTATSAQDAESNMVFVGLVGMIDPPREEVKEAIQLCQQAGIRSVMITGDHKLTAAAVAKELGLLKNGIAISGDKLDEISDEDLENMVEQIEVYARVSPAHKTRVIDAFTKKGHVVAMTGDGVNDAPALKKADIGIAMGITGTDVSKEVADMVLADDNFTSIVAAVDEGRGIFDNLKKFLVFILSCNLAELMLMAVAILAGPLLGLPYGALPLIAIQLLYVNLATDGLPAIALSLTRKEKGVMERPPRRRGEGVFTRLTLGYIGGIGIWKGAIVLASFMLALSWGMPVEQAQGFTFITLILVELANAFNCLNIKRSLFKVGPFTNRWLVLAVCWEILLLCLIVYVPFFQNLFHTYNLSLGEWIISLALVSSLFVVWEIAKLIVRWRERATG